MTPSTTEAPAARDDEIHGLYHHILAGWNKRDARAISANMAEDGSMVGFDGSQLDGRAQIVAELSRIFADHQPAAYVGMVRAVRWLAPDAAVLRAVAGMLPPGQTDIEPKLNTIHTLVAARTRGQWRAVLFQSTPAQFHGRPDLVQSLTDELRQLLPRT